MRRLALLGMLLTACTGTTAEPTLTITTAAGRAQSTTVVTVPALADVVVRLSDAEAVAASGVSVEVGGAVRLTGTESARLALPVDRPVTVAINYVVDGLAADPTWQQEAQAVAGQSVELVIEQPWRETVPVQEPIVLAWQAGGDSAGYLEQLEAAPGLTVTSPRWWSLDADGLLVGETDPEFVLAAHDLGIDVWPYVTNGFEPTRTTRALAEKHARDLLAAQLSEAARLAGADGVNVDFEAFSSDDRDHFTAFVTELSRVVHGWGGLVSVDITVRTSSFAAFPGDPFKLYDRRALAEASDYLALMAYDEYTTVRPSGPTASQAWVEEGLHWLFRYADPHQVLLGIPFYSRIWDPTSLSRPTTARIGTVVELATSNPRSFDPRFGIDRVDLDDGRYVWAEDYDNLAARIDLARQSGVAGTAAWRLGFDTPEVWPIVAP